MKHSIALSERGTSLAPLMEFDRPNCQTELIHLYDGFWDDVNWGVYFCPSCEQIICCVGGGVHHWNFTSASPRQENIARGKELAHANHLQT